jgi:hypothetical protein
MADSGEIDNQALRTQKQRGMFNKTFYYGLKSDNMLKKALVYYIQSLVLLPTAFYIGKVEIIGHGEK